MTYLIEHPPARPQFRTTRRAPAWHPDSPTVTAIVVHTAESTLDEIAPDTGAENVAHFISARTDAAGSYHSIVDSDSTVPLVPYEAEAYGESTGGNRWALHLAFAMRAQDWPHDYDPLNDDHRWFTSALMRAAIEANRMRAWVLDTYGVDIPAQGLSRFEYRNGVPGFIGHGDIDPDRRTDPGDRFPWKYFLELVEDLYETETRMTFVEQWQQALVDAGHNLGVTGPNNDGVDGDFGALTLTASLPSLTEFKVVRQSLIDVGAERAMLATQLGLCKDDLRHDFLPEDAILGRAARQWIRAMEADHIDDDG